VSALWASGRYELLMQLRKRSLWITTGVLLVLLGLVSRSGIIRIAEQPDARTAMVATGQLLLELLPIGFGCLVADRLVRDDILGVRPLLDATPAGPAARLGGKYLGACAAAGLPIVGLYLLIAAVYAVGHADPAAVGWALAVSAVTILPALLFVGAFALVCPLLMPATLFRVLFVGYWFWSTVVGPRLMPTLTDTLLSPTNHYPVAVFLGYHDQFPYFTGPVPGATLNALRPPASPLTAALAVAVLLGAAALTLAAARARLARNR